MVTDLRYVNAGAISLTRKVEPRDFDGSFRRDDTLGD